MKWLQLIFLRLVLIVFGILLSLPLMEFTLARFYPQDTYDRVQAQAVVGMFRESPHLIWELVPQFNQKTLNNEVTEAIEFVKVEINSKGFRDTEFSTIPDPQTYRIMAVGDSFTFGLNVNNFEDYPFQLELCLAQRLYSTERHYEVINAGYASGFSPDSYYVFARQIAPQYQPDMMLVGLYIDNDFVDLYDTVWLQEAAGYPLQIASQTRFLNTQGQLTYRSTLPRYQIPRLRNSHTFQLAMGYMMDELGWFKGEIPKFVEEKSVFDEVFDPAFPQAKPELYGEVLHLLQGIDELGKQNGYQVMTLFFPPGLQTEPTVFYPEFPFRSETQQGYPQVHLAEDLARLNLAYFDLLPTFDGHLEFYYAPRLHWTSTGNRVAAQAICEHLIQSQFQADLLGLGGVTGIQTAGQLDLYHAGEKIFSLSPDDLTQTEFSDSVYSLRITPTLPNQYDLVLAEDESALASFSVRISDGMMVFVSPLSDLSLAEPKTVTQQNYDIYVASQPFDGQIIFNPSTFTFEENNRMVEDIYAWLEAHQAGDETYYPLLWLVQKAQSHTLPTEQVSTWRSTKTAADLPDIDYLFIPPQWFSWLSAEEQAPFADPQQYRLVETWTIPDYGDFRLYEVVSRP